MFARVAIFVYGLGCCAILAGTFLYAIGFTGNLVVPKSMDSAPEGSVAEALVIDIALLSLIGLQHSLMAREWFKSFFIRVVPKAAERSTCVLSSSLMLLLLFWQWRPIGGVIWDPESPSVSAVVYTLFAYGWVTVLVSTFLIDHFDFFGLRQAYLYLRLREYAPVVFKTRGPWRYVCHTHHVGWLLVFWSASTMTLAHLVFAMAASGYILMQSTSKSATSSNSMARQTSAIEREYRCLYL